MVADSYTREIIVSNTPNAAYRALTSEFNKWWTDSSGSVTAIGDMVTFRFDQTYWTMRATKLMTNISVELACIEAHHVHEGLPPTIRKEWEGTKLKWNIQQQGDNTKISFVHEGLVPSLDCYEICKMGWDHFFVNSLKKYLDNGAGNPGAIEEQ
ncbi:MAG: SRPBCC domain-containing protein [Thermodesulfobacteriota bacterium]